MTSHGIPVHGIKPIGIYLRNQDAEKHAAKPFNIHRPCTVDFWPDSLLVKNHNLLMWNYLKIMPLNL